MSSATLYKCISQLPSISIELFLAPLIDSSGQHEKQALKAEFCSLPTLYIRQ